MQWLCSVSESYLTSSTALALETAYRALMRARATICVRLCVGYWHHEECRRLKDDIKKIEAMRVQSGD